MRHRKSGRKLKRTATHRKSLLASLATSLLRHKRITTTVAKAKETQVVVEKLITKSRRALAAGGDANADTPAGRFLQSAGPARREVGRTIKDRSVLTELFSTIAPKVADRPGGYTRIVKLGQRPGDGAELAVLELVDFQTGPGESVESAVSKNKKKGRTKSKGTKGSRKEEAAPATEAEASS